MARNVSLPYQRPGAGVLVVFRLCSPFAVVLACFSTSVYVAVFFSTNITA